MSKKKQHFYQFEEIRIDPETGLTWKAGELIPLEPKVAKTLLTLVKARGRLVTKEELIREVWEGIAVTDYSLTRNISLLRRTLGKGSDGNEFIKNVPKRGYCFNLPISEHWGDPEAQGRGSGNSAGGADELELGHKGNTGEGHRPKLPVHTPSLSAGSSPRQASRRMWALFIYVVLGLIVGITFIRFMLPSSSMVVVDSTQLTHENRELGYSLFTDGSYLFFGEALEGRQEIARVPVRGGETTFIPTPFRLPILVGILPDKTALIIADGMDPSTATLWQLPLHGGPLQPLRSLTDLHTFHFSLSPDAKNVAFIQENPSSLAVVPTDGGAPRRVFSVSSGYVHSPHWSPDGKSISFAWFDPDGAQRTGAQSEWTVSPDGSNAKLLVPQESAPSDGNWMPDGRHLVFASSQNSKRDLWTIARETWLPRMHPIASRLTNGTLIFDAPLPSPDGRRIFVLGKQNLGQLVRYDRKLNSFSTYLSGISANQTDFSRDGEWITYISYPNETIWRSRIDGTEKRQLTSSSTSADGPHWSPDGRRIAYRAAEPGHAEKKIFLISRDGGVPQELFPDDRQEEGIPTWSPDGNRLVFGELRYHPDQIAIHIVNLRSLEVTTIPGSQGLWTPRWSPDGRYLLALIADAATYVSKGIVLYDFRTEQWRKLIDHPVSDVAWSHNGQYIYFDLSIKPATDALFRVRASDGQLEQIVDLRAFPRSSGGSTGFSLAPDDSPVFLQEARQREIYALELR